MDYGGDKVATGLMPMPMPILILIRF